MLTKLMKYEWKAVWKVLLIINAFTVFATVLGMFAMNSLTFGIYSPAGDLLAVISIMLFLFYYATIIGVSFAMTIYVGIRFYRNLYTDEGYLMHTLPVTKRHLIISKLLVHGACMLITGLLVIISVCVLLLPLLARISGDTTLSVSYIVMSLARDCFDAFGISLPVFLLLCGVATIIGQISAILAIYCAISLGQTFHKHKVMGSILCYIGIYCLLQTLNSIVMMPQMMLSLSGTDFNMASYLNNTMLTTSVISLLTGIAFYLITLYMMDKKLNMD